MFLLTGLAQAQNSSTFVIWGDAGITEYASNRLGIKTYVGNGVFSPEISVSVSERGYIGSGGGSLKWKNAGVRIDLLCGAAKYWNKPFFETGQDNRTYLYINGLLDFSSDEYRVKFEGWNEGDVISYDLYAYMSLDKDLFVGWHANSYMGMGPGFFLIIRSRKNQNLVTFLRVTFMVNYLFPELARPGGGAMFGSDFIWGPRLL